MVLETPLALEGEMADPQSVALHEVLEDMVWQFGYRGVKNKRPVIHTGGLSALEAAFEVLGWEDPHYLPGEAKRNEPEN